jgi:hypothetical protein
MEIKESGMAVLKYRDLEIDIKIVLNSKAILKTCHNRYY